MTAIERTAYPRFSKKPSYSKEWLMTHFSLSNREAAFIKKCAYKASLRLGLAVQLKTFQYLGYFSTITQVPKAIIQELSKHLSIHGTTKPHYAHQTTLYRHRESIRLFLGIIKWETKSLQATGKSPQCFAIETAFQSAQTMNFPADIINVVIETLMQQNYELPAFSTLDRLVRHVRHHVNTQIFNVCIQGGLNPSPSGEDFSILKG